MSQLWTATFKVTVEVTFEDDGELDLRDQAFEALEGVGIDSSVHDVNLLAGSIKEVEGP